MPGTSGATRSEHDLRRGERLAVEGRVPVVPRLDVGAIEREPAKQAHVAGEGVDVLAELDGGARRRPRHPARPRQRWRQRPSGSCEVSSFCTAPGFISVKIASEVWPPNCRPKLPPHRSKNAGWLQLPDCGSRRQQHAGAVLDADEEAALEQVGDDQHRVGVLDVDPHLLEVGIVQEALDDDPRPVDDRAAGRSPRPKPAPANGDRCRGREEKRAPRPIDHRTLPETGPKGPRPRWRQPSRKHRPVKNGHSRRQHGADRLLRRSILPAILVSSRSAAREWPSLCGRRRNASRDPVALPMAWPRRPHCRPYLPLSRPSMP